VKISARQLTSQLSRGLASTYLVSGDEPLLVAEAAEQIRAAARRAGFDQRDLFVAERGFKWDELEASTDNLSLFAERRVVELRLPSPRPGDAGSKTLQHFAASPDPDRLVLVVTGKLDSAATRSSWVKAIESDGVVVQVWPIERAELPEWIGRRAQAAGLRLTRDAVELLADRVEGNLLAADQEIKKLALLGIDGAVDEQRVLAAVANSARFDVFELVDAWLAGDAARTFNVLGGLRAEGAEPVLLSWALSRELGLLGRLAAAVDRGQRLDSAFNEHKVWQRRQPVLRRALERYPLTELRRLLRQAVAVDRVIKGAMPGNPWQAVTQLLLLALAPRRGFAGVI
jgi:DNA polymerase-3 subunit delta